MKHLSRRTRLHVTSLAHFLALWGLYLVAVWPMHDWRPIVGLGALWGVVYTTAARMETLARRGLAADERERADVQRGHNPFTPPSFYCADCREWSLGGLLAFNEHRRTAHRADANGAQQ